MIIVKFITYTTCKILYIYIIYKTSYHLRIQSHYMYYFSIQKYEKTSFKSLIKEADVTSIYFTHRVNIGMLKFKGTSFLKRHKE